MEQSGEGNIARGLREGSADAWRAVYDAFALRVWHSVARRVGPSGSDVADIVQETFLAAARSARSYDPQRGSLWCWLSGIARLQTALFFRKSDSSRRNRTPISDDAFPAADAEPATLLAQAERAAEVRRALSKLPIEYEALLLGKYVDELSLDELAAAEGCSASALSSKLARARKAFREEFEKQSPEKPKREASV